MYLDGNSFLFLVSEIFSSQTLNNRPTNSKFKVQPVTDSPPQTEDRKIGTYTSPLFDENSIIKSLSFNNQFR